MMKNIQFDYNKSFFCLAFAFFICPLFSFPFIMYSVLKKHFFACDLLALFMGCCSVLWPPTADLYRHNMLYFEFHRMNVSQFFDYIETTPDFLYYLLSYLLSKVNINFEVIRFIFVFIAYKMSFRIYFDCMSRNKNIYEYHKMFFLIFYLSVPFFTITQGLRYGMALSFFAYGAYFYLSYDKIKWLIFVIIACLIHFSVFPVLAILLLARCGFNITAIRILLIIVVSVIFLRETALTSLIDLLPIDDLLKVRIGHYVEGYWSGEFLDEFSIENKISRFLEHCAMYPLLLTSFWLDENKYNQFTKILIAVVCICYLISFTMFFRISLLFVSVALCAFAIEFKQKKWNIIVLKMIFLSCFLSFFSQIYKYRREMTISREYLLVLPMPVLLINTFDYQWVVNNVDHSGAGINLKY